MEIRWKKDAQEKFDQLIGKVPVFMRGIAQEKVFQAAAKLIKEDGRLEITEKDMVDAFFKATPFGFHGPMKTDMEAIGIDYTQYGYER